MQLVSFSTLALCTLTTLVVFIDVASSLHLVMVAFTHSECFERKNPTLDYKECKNARMQAYKCDKEHNAMCKQMEVGVNLEQLQFLGKA